MRKRAHLPKSDRFKALLYFAAFKQRLQQEFIKTRVLIRREETMTIKFEMDECCCCCLVAGTAYLLLGASPAQAGDLETKIEGHELTINKSQTDIQTDPTTGKRNYVLRHIDKYQQDIGPALKAKLGKEDICRYEPSCSQYAKEAVEKYGQVKGSAMAAKRLLMCNPWSKGGYHPVK